MIPSPELRQPARAILLADVNYGVRFGDVPLLDDRLATAQAKAGDLIIQFVPQLERGSSEFNEHLLKGCMHLSTVASFSKAGLCKLEIIERGLFYDPNPFHHLVPFEECLRRYFLVLRSRRVRADELLRQRLNAAVIKLAGYQEEGGEPVAERFLHSNLFLRTHRIENLDGPLPSKLYCSELAYQAYKLCGIEICRLHSLDELVAMTGGLPPRREELVLCRRYAMGSAFFLASFLLLVEYERLMGRLRLHALRPSRILFRDGAWPSTVFENPEFELVAAVPPPERYIRRYERALEAMR